MRWKKYLVLILLACVARTACAIDEFEQPPIEYSASTPNNQVSLLQAAIERGEKTLDRDDRFGYLPSLLKSLAIDSESQMLVFSKTSMQRNRITPRTPRALYFNDDSYVGYCHEGDVIEIAVADPKLGAVFYTLDQEAAGKPTITRQTERCLQCHGTSQTGNLPGFVVRSLFVAPDGLPILSEGSHRVDQTTPIKDRWGGWYVTGTHGEQSHLGNLIVSEQDAPRPWKNAAGQNVRELGDRFATRNYLTAHSDIVALMVFEHQTFVHNLLTKANFAARQALHYEETFNRSLGEPAGNRLESTARRIEGAGDALLRGLLMSEEAPLTAPIAGTSHFTKHFSELGPHDSRGRSLRDLDLKTRLLKHPCSYLIYSPAFDELPIVMKAYVTSQLKKILAGNGGEHFQHLSESDRLAISEILRETKPDLLK